MRFRTAGFSLVDLLVAMALTTTLCAAVMPLIVAGQSIARMQPEASDAQQRARIVLQTFASELALAGAGLDRGPRSGPLSRYFPPVAAASGEGITLWYVSTRLAQTRLAGPLIPGATAVVVEDSTSFAGATTAIVFAEGGCHDVLRVEAVTPAVLELRAAARMCAYDAGASVAQGEVRTYYLDRASRQLRRRDEATGISVPILDNVTRLSLEYLELAARVRITLQVAAGVPNNLVPDLGVTHEFMLPNLQVR
jgi:type II secretory pathway pseudopilin PulG